jgi:hypothetical protein
MPVVTCSACPKTFPWNDEISSHSAAVGRSSIQKGGFEASGKIHADPPGVWGTDIHLQIRLQNRRGRPMGERRNGSFTIV